ncbi:MAG: hypothetical protein ACUVV0_14290 [Anaerolineae bacterium]
MRLGPNPIQIKQILMQALPIADLPGDAIILDVPVWRGGEDQVNRPVFHLIHRATVSDYNFGPVAH